MGYAAADVRTTRAKVGGRGVLNQDAATVLDGPHPDSVRAGDSYVPPICITMFGGTHQSVQSCRWVTATP